MSTPVCADRKTHRTRQGLKDVLTVLCRIVYAGVLTGIVFYTFTPAVATASDISLSMTVTARDDTIHVRVENRGRDAAEGFSLSVELDSQSYQGTVPSGLAAGAVTETELRVRRPALQGRYPLITRLGYRNEGQQVDLLDVGTFDYIAPLVPPIACPRLDLLLRSEYRTPLPTPVEFSARVIAPRGIDARLESSSVGALAASDLVLRSNYPELRLEGALAVVYERVTPVGHEAVVCRGRLQTRRVVYDRWPIGTRGLILITALLLGAAAAGARAEVTSGTSLPRRRFLFFRWIGTCGLLSAVLLFYRAIWDSMERLSHAASAQLLNEAPGPGRVFFLKAVDAFHLDGPNYDPFFEHVVPLLALYLVLAHYFTLAYLVRPEPETDKVWALLRAIGGKGMSDRAGIAFRVLAVKAFFLPLLGSWAVTRIFFEKSWSVMPASVESFIPWLIGIFILVDVVVFAVGYLVELPQLKNEIRSAEPTVLGWVVCILCYPPFNELFLPLIDHPLNSVLGEGGISGTGVPPMLHQAASWMTVILWAIYVSATLALGFKASNLTNRGIVERGPYRFVRHPAYASKLAVWVLSWAVFQTMNLTLILALLGLYGLRGLTEERHLSADPDYRDYMSRVKYRVIPGVW